jgi:putative membrane protein
MPRELLSKSPSEIRTTQGVEHKTNVSDNGEASVTLSVERTRLSYDRTLMSWIRTATSLITFGFSIYKFFQIEAERAIAKSPRLIGPREFAIMMIAIGVMSLLIATIEHMRYLHALKAQYPHAGIRRSFTVVIAGLISILGLIAFTAAVLRQ